MGWMPSSGWVPCVRSFSVVSEKGGVGSLRVRHVLAGTPQDSTVHYYSTEKTGLAVLVSTGGEETMRAGGGAALG